ncbi:DNA repair protein [Clostridium tetani]|uniref:AAA family ATPase n=1 Tax=Clostridium tetani TaxID=1513 RepID=UPI00100B21D5|nr:AAA family ATPase [Clostridium tetani]RXM77186.1 DNA repair protein [Clostridium tetani]RYU99431.1 DNA repair protein [Clostridium tetani]
MAKLDIKKLHLRGFKSYLESTELTFKNNTLIEGDNAQGKTSIGEAITWAFLGTDLTGNERSSNRLMNDKAKVTEVIVEFAFNEENHVLIRRKKGSTNEIYLDDEKVTNPELAKKFYEGKEVFLTIFNPYYFPSLTPKNAKEFLTGIMKEVNKEECLNELGDFLKDKLIKNKFLLNSVAFLKDKRAELRELEEDSIYLEGVIDGQIKIDIPEIKTFDDTELNRLKEELEGSQEVPEDKDLKSLEQELNKLNIGLMTIPYEKPQLVNIKYLETERTNLLNEYRDYKRQYDDLETKTIICNGCGNEIDINELERERLAKIMQSIIEKGKRKAIEIEKGKKENRKLELEYSEQVNGYRLEKTKKINEVKVKIETLKAKQKEENKAIETKKQELKRDIEELEKQKNEVVAFNMNIENLQKQQFEILEKIKESKDKLQSNSLKIKEINLLIDGAKQFNSIKLKKQTEFIGSYLNKVKLQFEKLTKDGEIKDDFKITYEGREFNVLSNAERIKAGLEISNLVMNVLDLRLPIFIDNAESITDIPEINTQLIISKVVEGKKLEVCGSEK